MPCRLWSAHGGGLSGPRLHLEPLAESSGNTREGVLLAQLGSRVPPRMGHCVQRCELPNRSGPQPRLPKGWLSRRPGRSQVEGRLELCDQGLWAAPRVGEGGHRGQACAWWGRRISAPTHEMPVPPPCRQTLQQLPNVAGGGSHRIILHPSPEFLVRMNNCCIS